jgi:hypothetical protein
MGFFHRRDGSTDAGETPDLADRALIGLNTFPCINASPQPGGEPDRHHPSSFLLAKVDMAADNVAPGCWLDPTACFPGRVDGQCRLLDTSIEHDG